MQQMHNPVANEQLRADNALATVLDRASKIRVEIPKQIVIFCGAGLAVSLLLASYGLDLSAGFF